MTELVGITPSIDISIHSAIPENEDIDDDSNFHTDGFTESDSFRE